MFLIGVLDLQQFAILFLILPGKLRRREWLKKEIDR